MSTTTSNFGLVKPQLTDAADITGLNKNWNTLDNVINAFSKGVLTTGDGTHYEVNIPGITKLETGLTITIIPNTTSATTTPDLNVNGLGAKYIRRKKIGKETVQIPSPGEVDSWISGGEAIQLTYDGNQWKTDSVLGTEYYTYGTADLTAGSSTLPEGKLYFVYE